MIKEVKYLESEGVKIRYAVTEGRRGPILLLNGIFMRIESWLPLLQYFEDYQIILHDMRCQGESSSPQNTSFEEHVEDLRTLMEELSIDSAHIVGTSYGGEVAMYFALKYPDMTKSLSILTATSEISEDMYYMALRWKVGAESKDPFKFVLSWINDVYSSKFIREHPGFLDMLANNLKDFNFDGAVTLLNSFLSLRNNPLTPMLKEIKSPTLIISASEDRVKPPEFSMKIYKEIENSIYYEIPNAGHAVVIEKPREVAILIKGFLEGV
ncbi:MAG TPA: alpha/beta hydrolase [Euryarchaeota archaeon]|nr:alpha/beta hydrolase [Euryarchaeota archaeon]